MSDKTEAEYRREALEILSGIANGTITALDYEVIRGRTAAADVILRNTVATANDPSR